ncbi:PepSY-associated TM helix domain-containing protein [Stutzerimonas stutzeri]|uniref:PepSY-associated TM helix domain-containing protein n=1 Tax=Stutzerimonas stutzeri TaxID=316 RepID=UPI00210B0518|nr:PepSY-associated TM helix domain-containing protein [Stutzerimonas stutzeri]MCQ4258027.1 PepSY domain-containing protein [Stutzerimonas stutzeri]
MAWLHTWAGVLLGGLLLAIFWTGSLSVFDREIDRWMQPDTRLPAPAAQISLDQLVLPHAQRLAQDAPVWSISLPTPRAPTLHLDYQLPHQNAVRRHIDPHTGELLADQGSWGGTRFIFPFHFSLHLGWRSVGYWPVGAAGMGMLVLLVSGVVAHRKLIAEFFTFRPHKRLQRSLLDLHNLTGVLVLPFHFVITLSGLIIFYAIYFPGITQGLYPQGRAQLQMEALGNYSQPASGLKADTASLDAMLSSAQEAWQSSGKPGQAYFVRVWHPGDRNQYVEVRRSHAREVTMNADRLTFDGTTGELLHQHSAAPIADVQRFFTGLHFIQFDHWTLRWLYFTGGLSGCVLIGTGLLFWSGSRRPRHERQGRIGARLVYAICVSTATGLVIATLVFFIANRLLPAGSQWLGQPREALEGWAFYLGWLVTLVHAAACPGNAWRRQLQSAAVLAVSAVALNAITTGDALPLSLFSGSAAVAGMDLMLLVLAGFCLLASRRIRLAQVTPSPTRRPAREALPRD